MPPPLVLTPWSGATLIIIMTHFFTSVPGRHQRKHRAMAHCGEHSDGRRMRTRDRLKNLSTSVHAQSSCAVGGDDRGARGANATPEKCSLVWSLRSQHPTRNQLQRPCAVPHSRHAHTLCDVLLSTSNLQPATYTMSPDTRSTR